MENHQHLTGFRREILNELQYAESQLLALAWAIYCGTPCWLEDEELSG